jgi:hypothetical protein
MATQQDIATEQARRFKIQQSWQTRGSMEDWFATHSNDPFTKDIIKQGIYQPAIRASNIGAINVTGEAYGGATEGKITSPFVIAKLDNAGNVVWGNSTLTQGQLVDNSTKYWNAVKTDIDNTISSQTAASQASANALAQEKAAAENAAWVKKLGDFKAANPDFVKLISTAYPENTGPVLDTLSANIVGGTGSIADYTASANKRLQDAVEAKAYIDNYNAQLAKQDAAEKARLTSIAESTKAREAQAVKDKSDGEAAISKYTPIISQAMGEGKFYNDSQLQDLITGIRNGSQPWQSLQTMAETAQQWVAQNSKVPVKNVLDTTTKVTDNSIKDLTNTALGTSQPNVLSTSSAGALGTSQIGALSSTQLATLDSAVKNGFYSAEQVASIKTAVNNGTMDNAQLGTILKTAADKNATVVTDKIGTQGSLGTGSTSALGTGSTSALGTGSTSALGTGSTSALGTGSTSALGTGSTSALGTGSTSALGTGSTSALGTGSTSVLGTGSTSALGTGSTSALGTGSTSALGTGSTSALGTGSTSALGTGSTSALGTGSTSVLGTGSIPALTTADLASWTSSLPQGISSQQLTDALKTQQDTLNKSYANALAGNQTALSSQNAEFLKNWNTSADALKNSILSGVDTKSQAFGTQATQGFMDAFKNFQIPTNQQTGVNLGNYNDNRNAAADQWWSQYVTGRR